jgi:hypothetical protein
MWFGLGSSNSSTRPNTGTSLLLTGPVTESTAGVKESGDGGGLRDLDRRASSWRKAMGENIGVGGADELGRPTTESDDCNGPIFSCSAKGGKALYEDVTRIDLSTALRYFPKVL